jgi:hypothetical protein
MTDDDICGHPTGDGGKCQNPPTEGDHCWIDTHGGDVSGHGRDFSIGETDHEDILDAARDGVSKRGCARAAGVSHTELQRYLDAHPDFRASFARARNQGERTLICDGLRDPDTDSSMAKFLLASSFDYKKTEKREVDADVDVDASHDVTADFVTYSSGDGDE